MLNVSLPIRSSEPKSRQSLLCAAVVLAAFAISFTRLVGFVADNAVDLLFDDQWDYLNPLFNGEGPLSSFFYQHGPPRLGLGGWIEWFLYTATGWDVRAVSWLAAGVLTFAALSAVFLTSRLRGRIHWIDAGIPLLLLSPIHWESMTLTPSVAPMILPLLLAILIALGWSFENPTTQFVFVSLFGVLNLFTGYGACSAPVVIGLAVLLLFRPTQAIPHQRRTCRAILMIMVVAILLFAHGYKWAPGVPGWRFPVPNWWDYPRFCALMFTSLLGFRSLSWPATLLGALLLSLVTLAFIGATIRIWRKQSGPRIRTIWFLAGTSLTYSVFTAIGRLPINIEGAFMWRYITLMTPSICGLALAAEEWAPAKSTAASRFLKVGWLLLALAIWSNFKPEQYAGAVAAAKRKWAADYLRTRDLKQANVDSNFWVYYPEPGSPRIAERLRWLEAHHLSLFRSVTKTFPSSSQ